MDGWMTLSNAVMQRCLAHVWPSPVDRAKEKAKAVEGSNERTEVGGDNADSPGGEGSAEDPGHGGRELSGGDRQERFVHCVDVDVVYLVDADDVSVAAEESEEAAQRTGDQGPVDGLERTGTSKSREQGA